MGEMKILWLLHVVLWVYAVVNILNSSATTTKKILWIALVAILPLLGLIIWFFAGPGTPSGKR